MLAYTLQLLLLQGRTFVPISPANLFIPSHLRALAHGLSGSSATRVLRLSCQQQHLAAVPAMRGEGVSSFPDLAGEELKEEEKIDQRTAGGSI